MAYCTASDAQAKLQNLVLADGADPSTPSLTQVGTFCADISADMDSRMQAVGILVPVTAAAKVTVLKTIATYGVLAMIWRALDLEVAQAEVWQRLYDNAMRDIMKNPAMIQVAQSQSSAPSGSTAQTTRPFRRDSKDW